MKLLEEKYDGLQQIGDLSYGLKRFLSEPDIQRALQKSDLSVIYGKVHIELASEFTQLMNSLNIDPLEYLNYIPNWFLSNTTIRSITIPTYIKRIGSGAFQNCVQLTHITIPDSVIDIGTEAFAYCKGLTSIVIPDSVISISHGCFRNCTYLASITLTNNITTISNSVFENCRSLKSIVIPDGVTSIGYQAFLGCDKLTSITIPGSVIDIGSEVFSYCKKLKEITYKSTKEDWNKIVKLYSWDYLSSIKTIHCTDGDINL